MERDKSKSEEEIRSTESLHEHHCFTAAQGQSPLRVDKFLMTRIEMLHGIKFNKQQNLVVFLLEKMR